MTLQPANQDIDILATSFLTHVEEGEKALQAADDDYERIRIRDEARAQQVLAQVLSRETGGLEEVVKRCAELVARAERAVAEANRDSKPGRPPGNNVPLGEHLPRVTKSKIKSTYTPLSEEEFEEVLEQAEGPVTRKDFQDRVREKQREELKAQREQERQAAQELEQPQGKYEVLYADPPWEYDFAPIYLRGASVQYPVASVAQLAEIEPPAAANAVLYLWATAPKLQEALDLMAAWNFTYKSHMIWDKQKAPRQGQGYWFAGHHELLLVGTRGKFSPPPSEHKPDSIYREKSGKHSVKPDAVRDMITTAFPDYTKIELFARQESPGWATWGLDMEGQHEGSKGATDGETA